MNTIVEVGAEEAEARAALLLGEEGPEAVLAAACRECAQFASECLGRGVAPTVLELPQLKTSAMLQWGVVAMAEIPPRAKLNGLQERAKMAALSGNVIFTRELGYALSRIEWPCYYLDFETVATTLPLEFHAMQYTLPLCNSSTLFRTQMRLELSTPHNRRA